MTAKYAIAGASGFVGSRLTRRLRHGGAQVRCLVRRPAAMPGAAGIEIVKLDFEGPPAALAASLDGIDTAYYLVHAMKDSDDFAARDRRYARQFGSAASSAGVRRVVYLGGLYPRHVAPLSPHLASRREVGEILMAECGALVVRAGIIVGRGSASFEIMLALVRKLPVMVTPRWVSRLCQPIYIDDAVETLARAGDVPGNREADLVGPDVMSYRDMMMATAQALGLRRLIIPVPVFTPELSSHWLRFISSVPLPVARSLVESLRYDTVAEGPDLCREVGVQPIDFKRALQLALSEIEQIEPTDAREGGRYL